MDYIDGWVPSADSDRFEATSTGVRGLRRQMADDDVMEDMDGRVGPVPAPASVLPVLTELGQAELRQPRSSTLPIRGPTPLPRDGSGTTADRVSRPRDTEDRAG